VPFEIAKAVGMRIGCVCVCVWLRVSEKKRMQESGKQAEKTGEGKESKGTNIILLGV
jgi:hypothetical protein